ncbi:MAG: LysM peptidoglycan-binding domain-containing protein [Pseudomonadales bacterium]|nr:LysM peptidoglycan-binding domain-containing protein [Pseudomonadales bacterium]
MRYPLQFSIIAIAIVSLTGCQMLSSVNESNQSANPVEADSTDLSKLVSEEIVIAAAMPITADGQDDIVERADDPAPLEPILLSPAEIEDLWIKVRAGFKLDHHIDNPRVKSELNWFLRHPAYIERVTQRATRYLYHIVNELEARDLPMELALLPVVESAYDPFAYSHGKASGLWQFIPSTGKLYGLKIDYWYDGRRNVVEATDAALTYLTDSHKSLNQDWMLALAAYNSGEGNVRYSMRKNTRAGKPIDFFSLHLFRETQAYVPRLLAISELIANAEAYGIELKPIINEPYFEIVDVGSQIDLARAAELAEISIEELYLLNPAFNKWTSHPDGPHELLVPKEKAAIFTENLAKLPADQRIAWKRHQIRSGDNLGSIAQKYQTTVSTIKNVNNLRNNVIVTGDSLLIPIATANLDDYQLSDSGRLKTTQAYVEKKYGAEPQKYTVKSGDSFWELSRTYGVSMRSLAKWNGMATTDLLYPGKELLIFNTKSNPSLTTVASLPSNMPSNNMIRKVNYRVRSGESLARIADKFNVSLSSIRKWNQSITAQKYIQPGDRLTLYVDITRTE